MLKYFRKGSLEQKKYKKQANQRQKINRSSSVFVSLCFFPTFFTFSLKTKAKHQIIKRYTLTNNLPSPPPLLTFLSIALQKTHLCKTLQLLSFFLQLSNINEPEKQLHKYWPTVTSFETRSLILRDSDKLHTLAVERVKFHLSKAKIEEKAQLAMINSRQSLTVFKTICQINKKILESLRKVFAHAS